MRALVAGLSDEGVRQLIIAQLDRFASEQEQQPTADIYVGRLREGIRIAIGTLGRVFASGSHARALPRSIWRELTDDGRISGWYLLKVRPLIAAVEEGRLPPAPDGKTGT